MGKGTIYLLCIFLFLGLSPVFPTNHFVDKYATGNNNGSSWTNAWVSFGSINWNIINPGDTIFISGGTDSTVYNKQLTISASGTNINPIIITRGNDPRHSGKVIIDGLKTYFNIINISGKGNIVVSNLFLRNSGDTILRIRDSQHITIEHCYVHMTNGTGIQVMNCENVIIRNCTITTDSFINNQTDGIYSQNNVNNIYENNYIVISNSDPNGHDDCIQSYKDFPLIIRDNYVEQNNSKTSNAQGIYITTPAGSGTFRIYNNIFNATLSSSNGITFNRLTGNNSARVQIIENTVYGVNLWSQYRIILTTDPVVKNNIGYSVNGNGIVIMNNVSFTDPGNVDNNIWKCNSENPIIINGHQENWSSWQGSGFDVNSYRTDPMFNDVSKKDFTLQSSSDGIDNGQPLPPPYNTDFNGTSRPLGKGWDIGAFEIASNDGGGTHNDGVTHFLLNQNYPNPFNPTTKISFTLPKETQVKLDVYNVLGVLVTNLIDMRYPAGTHFVNFNGSYLSSGIYFYTLQADNFRETKKMVLLK